MSAVAKKRDELPVFALSAKAGDLAYAIRAICRVVPANHTIPILRHTLLRFSGGWLRVSGTNLDQSISVEIEATGEGVITVPAHRLLSFVLSLPKESDLKASAYNASVASFSSGRASRDLPTLPVDEFPQTETITADATWKVPCTELAQICRDILPATNKENNRTYLNGFYFVPGEKSEVVATNGHILGIEKLSGLNTEGPPFILPNETVPLLQEVLKSGDIVSIVLQNQRCVEFKSGNIVVWSKLVDGTYPDYTRLIPTEFDRIISVPTDGFLDAIRRGADVVDGEYKRSPAPAKLKFGKDSVQVSSHCPSTGERSSDECECSIVRGAALDTGAKVSYLEWAIDSLGKTKTRHVATSQYGDALIITDPENKGAVRLVMPMRA